MPNPKFSAPTKYRGPLVVETRGANPKAADQQVGDSGYQAAMSIRTPVGYGYNLLEFCQPAPYGAVAGVPTGGVVLSAVDNAGGLLLSGAILTSQRVTRVALTAAQLIAMYAAPVLILAAPASGAGLAVGQILFEMVTTSTPFTGGGIVVFQYGVTANGAGTATHAGSVPAAVVKAGTGTTLTLLGPASAANGLTVPTDGTTASGIYISNQTAAFAAGTGASAIVTISYDVVTLG
jgi:hypothetical protein